LLLSQGFKIKAGRVFGVRRFALVALCLLACSVLLPRITGAVWTENSQAAKGKEAKGKTSRAEFVPGEVLVRFRQDTPGGKGAARANMTLRTETRTIEVLVEQFSVSESVEGLRLARVEPEETLAAVDALNARPDVLYAEPNYILRKAALPNDPRFSELWGLKNTSYPTADIDAEQAWNTTTGSRTIVVGVIDEGIDVNHEDLRDNIWRNHAEAGGTPGFDDDGNGYVDDINGWDFYHDDRTLYDGPGTNPDGSILDAHGTHVAGTIGASGNNGRGIAGVNWQVSLLPLKILGPDGGSTADAIRAYDYARTMRQRWDASGGTQGANIRVLNNSYGGRGFSQAALDAIRALGDAGILFVTSAGNEARNNDRFPAYPSSYQTPNLVSVAATGFTGLPSTQFSNYGPRGVDLVAPGENILSTTPGNTYDKYYGTSMAAPHASGTAALVCAAYPDIPLRRLRAALVYGGSQGFAQFTSSGKRLNARGSLDNAAETDTTAPAALGDLSISSQGNQKFTLRWSAPGDDGAGGASVAIYEVRYSDANPATPGVFDTAYRLDAPAPAAPGSIQTVSVAVPYRHATGFVAVRAIDNAGNAAPLAVVNLNADIADADPYTLSVAGAGEALSTGGTPLGLRADEAYLTYQLPFEFTFFGRRTGGITLSTNGAIHFAPPTQLPDGSPDVDVSGTDYLSARQIIAGLWDDLRTDRRAGDDVYVLQPDPERVIFRWQAVTYNYTEGLGAGRGENPVNFEIELRRDGTFLIRYGEGNHNLLPVVGAAGGEPDPYIVGSHTSEFALKDLNFAPVVAFTPRRPTPPPAADLAVSVRITPDPAATGQQLIYQIEASNRSFDQTAERVSVVTQLPQGVGFVSCASTYQSICNGPAVGSTGAVTVSLNRLSPISTAMITIVVQVNAPPGSTLHSTTSIANFWNDPNPSNNTVTSTTAVLNAAVFAGVRAITGSGSFNGGHTFALKSDGTLWAWGMNSFGQLGDGFNYASVNVPVRVVNLSDVSAADAGSEHALALKRDGTVWAWGNNSYGQGGGYDLSGSNRTRPAPVAGLSGAFKAIAAGSTHSLALRSDGTVWAWGSNVTGQLGNGSTDSNAVYDPLQVAGLTNVTAIAASSMFSLAVKSDGTVWAWGANSSGVVGKPYDTYSVATPVQVAGLNDILTVSAGERHALALKRDGTVWAWGDNFEGKLGNGNNGSGTTPTQVSGLTSVREISAGSNHSIALKTDGTVWAWGRNASGALGDGTMNNRSVPVQVGGLSGITSIAAGYDHSGAVLPDGTVRMWGMNREGQLGDRTHVSRTTPTDVSGPYEIATPIFSPDGGSFNSPQGVIISCATPGVFIHYTTDGAEPTENDPALISNSTIYVERTLTLKAKAFKHGWLPGGVKSADFIFPATQPTPAPTPVPGAGNQPIAFSRSLSNGPDIFLMNPDGTGEVNLTNRQGSDYDPAWSPDGKKIAFVTLRGFDGKTKIYVMNADGTDPKNLSYSSNEDSAPAWSPDGTQIAFVSYGVNFPSRIYVMNTDGTGRRPVGEIEGVGSPSWSPDGQSIVFTSMGRSSEIWAARVDGGSTVRLTNNSWSEQMPVYSPDGRKIAFVSDRHGDIYNNEIYVMNADGTNPVRLTNSPGWDGSPSWSPNGTQIIFDSQRDGMMGSEIYLMNADGTNQIRVTDGTASEGGPVWRPRVSPVVQFERAAYSVSEGAGAATFTVTRKGDTSGVVSVDYATVDETASAGFDYNAANGTITFNAGETAKTFSAGILEDALAEEAETFGLRLSNPTGGAELGSPASATLTINDNEACFNSISPASRTSPPSGERLAVQVNARGGCAWTAASNSNFININSEANGSGNGSVTLAIFPNGSGVPRVGTVSIAGQTLTVTQAELPPEVSLLQFSRHAFQSGEADGSATLSVTRLGNKSREATVNYRTMDDPADVPCNPQQKRTDGTSYPQGTAYARCDYATTVDTLTFLPGEESKQIAVPLIDDVYAEGVETLGVRLFNPQGATLSETTDFARLLIHDNDATTGSENPSRSTTFFVRMHYLDFLSREPEANEPWSRVLNNCPNPFNFDARNPSAACDRLIVSQSFFGSREFRLKGFYTYTFYRVALQRRPAYEEIIPDMRSVTGQSGAEVFHKRTQFAEEFAGRAEFKARYDALSDTAYVNALFDRYNLPQVTTPDPQNPEGSDKVTLTRAELIARLSAGATQGLTRAQVLRAIVESDEVGRAEYNGAFVAMQYYGYLRRTPEESGYQAWLRVINEDPNNVRIMVNGFLNSTEYRIRFGLP
jgi:alpha-tubulin suppressor-like RCC1 family protein/Tol biopolymer transport system component/subtilisin family serine protease